MKLAVLIQLEGVMSLVCDYADSDDGESCASDRDDTTPEESASLLLPGGRFIEDASSDSNSDESDQEPSKKKQKGKHVAALKKPGTASKNILPGAFDALESSSKPSFLDVSTPNKAAKCCEIDEEKVVKAPVGLFLFWCQFQLHFFVSPR